MQFLPALRAKPQARLLVGFFFACLHYSFFVQWLLVRGLVIAF
jgi:hypothetical protein